MSPPTPPPPRHPSRTRTTLSKNLPLHIDRGLVPVASEYNQRNRWPLQQQQQQQQQQHGRRPGLGRTAAKRNRSASRPMFGLSHDSIQGQVVSRPNCTGAAPQRPVDALRVVDVARAATCNRHHRQLRHSARPNKKQQQQQNRQESDAKVAKKTTTLGSLSSRRRRPFRVLGRIDSRFWDASFRFDSLFFFVFSFSLRPSVGHQTNVFQVRFTFSTPLVLCSTSTTPRPVSTEKKTN